METALHDRSRVGVDDFILLEDYTSIDAFVNNLKKRQREDIIYTSIGNVLISVNPYKELPVYNQDYLTRYRQFKSLWLPPHIFSDPSRNSVEKVIEVLKTNNPRLDKNLNEIYLLANNAYQSLTEERRSQCIFISGESGSGKTETSKKVLQFVAEAAGRQETIETVKDKLLQSNPLLEAFGNAKTNKNDNSSRFGKYMDVEFNFMGKPVGGKILNYLLEKSRVVTQNGGERNFHIFYQLLDGAQENYLQGLHLASRTDAYGYLKNGKISNFVNSLSDAKQFEIVREAMDTIEISKSVQEEIFKIVASVLHLGNVTFSEVNDVSEIRDMTSVQYFCELLGCEKEQFVYALTNRTIEAGEDVMIRPLNEELSMNARDALAKAMYTRLFNWLVTRLNESLRSADSSFNIPVLGILDIYGFEVFEKNSYEQFCINYCNEKMQQVFIELTLKGEQLEYLKEGIEWVPIEFFDNKIICELIEEKHKGIIGMLNEECLRPGDTSDRSFLEKMNRNLATHKRYISHMKSDTKTQKIMAREEFRLLHYAGEVIYDVNGFLEKNSDLLFRDLVELMANTTNSITKSVFTKNELKSKKRPETAINQFKYSLNNLIEILMNKDPSYVRCIKPNECQEPDTFDDELVKHQVKYLGLMENLKVRRAGFAYRRIYEEFLKRYKPLNKKTWPVYTGSPKDGVKLIIAGMGFDDSEYALGRTKLFIRSPAALFKIEDAYQEKKHDLAAIIQAAWRGKEERKKYLGKKAAIIQMQKIVRGFIARRRVKRTKEAALIIRRFIEGYVRRNEPETDVNRRFVQLIKARWLMKLSQNLPKNVLDKSWPPCPRSCEEASAILRDLRMKQLALIYRSSITPEMKKKFQEKILAEFLFKGRKRTYESSIPEWFERDRLTPEQRQMMPNFRNKHLTDEKLLYSTKVTKYDRHGYKMRNRALFFTNKYIYLVDGKTFKLKHKILYKDIVELTVTTEGDNFLLVRISLELVKDKGDLILCLPNLIEAVTIFIDLTQKPKVLKVTNESKILHYLIKEKPRSIKVVAGSTGSIPDICKNKSGELVIMG